MKAIKIVFLLMALDCFCCTGPQEELNFSNPMPVIAWFGVPEDETTITRYQEMATSGINYEYTNFSTAEKLEKALGIAHLTNVEMIISCPDLYTNTESTVRHFMYNPSVAGYFLKDEPSRADFHNLALLVKKIQAIDDQHFCYINLLPNYAGADQLGTSNYREYVNAFINEVPIKILSFDSYPIYKSPNGFAVRSDWYQNLEIFSDEALKAHKSFWAFALTTAYANAPVPTLATIRLEVYSNLAYGAQGIQYFTYWTPGSADDYFHDGPIDQDSTQSRGYSLITTMNTEIQHLSGVFVGSKRISVAHTGNSIPLGTKPLGTLPKPIKLLETTGEGAVVSQLEKGSFTFLVVVNRDVNNPMQLKIRVDPNVQRVLKSGLAVYPDNALNIIALDPGDVAIFRWPTI